LLTSALNHRRTMELSCPSMSACVRQVSLFRD
jgi:hypothetical protein